MLIKFFYIVSFPFAFRIIFFIMFFRHRLGFVSNEHVCWAMSWNNSNNIHWIHSTILWLDWYYLFMWDKWKKHVDQHHQPIFCTHLLVITVPTTDASKSHILAGEWMLSAIGRTGNSKTFFLNPSTHIASQTICITSNHYGNRRKNMIGWQVF